MDDQTLPDGVHLVRTTPVLDEDTTPAGLRSVHQIADGVWGRLVVETGSLQFAFEDTPDRIRTIGAGESQVIPPRRPHHVAIVGPVRFVVEFHRSG